MEQFYIIRRQFQHRITVRRPAYTINRYKDESTSAHINEVTKVRFISIQLSKNQVKN